MSKIISNVSSASHFLRSATRAFSSTPALSIKKYREQRGLPVNRNAEGALTDGPDYTFLDGRPTPLLQKQKLRMLKQQGFAAKIVELSRDLDFALERERKTIEARDQERQSIIENRLKPKGSLLFKRK